MGIARLKLFDTFIIITIITIKSHYSVQDI